MNCEGCDGSKRISGAGDSTGLVVWSYCHEHGRARYQLMTDGTPGREIAVEVTYDDFVSRITAGALTT